MTAVGVNQTAADAVISQNAPSRRPAIPHTLFLTPAATGYEERVLKLTSPSHQEGPARGSGRRGAASIAPRSFEADPPKGKVMREATDMRMRISNTF